MPRDSEAAFAWCRCRPDWARPTVQPRRPTGPTLLSIASSLMNGPMAYMRRRPPRGCSKRGDPLPNAMSREASAVPTELSPIPKPLNLDILHGAETRSFATWSPDRAATSFLYRLDGPSSATPSASTASVSCAARGDQPLHQRCHQDGRRTRWSQWAQCSKRTDSATMPTATAPQEFAGLRLRDPESPPHFRRRDGRRSRRRSARGCPSVGSPGN